ncbi:MAG TPA: hypothetical protein VD926_14750 [Acidimicrobiales bacterium]|nr:hypothetical protein [Acidimicrobiales bacterium]
MTAPLAGRVALVAGGTRGAGRGIAVELGAAGATVYVTGRTTRAQRSEMDRPETIEETAELVDEAGGTGIAVSLTPGWLRSEAMLDAYGVTEANWRDALRVSPHFAISETPRFVGRAVAALAADSDVARWNQQSLSSGQLAQVYGFTDVDGSRPDAWRYVVEVQDAGRPADVTGYR